MNRYRKHFAVASVAALATVAFAYQAAVTTLYQDGKLVSSNVKTIDGQLYVPVTDLVSYVGGTIQQSTARADITSSTNSNGLPLRLDSSGNPLSTSPIGTMADITAPPPAPAVTIQSHLNDDVVVGDFAYRVTGIKSEDRTYREQFDQRGQKLHPGWSTDKLEIFFITVTNRGTQAGTPFLPGSSDFTIFDDQKVGYTSNNLDIRQASVVQGDDLASTSYSDSPVSIIGPGGSLSYAVIGSIPKESHPTMVEFHIAPMTGMATGPNAANVSGADVTITL
jgi:hypothetical protein